MLNGTIPISHDNDIRIMHYDGMFGRKRRQAEIKAALEAATPALVEAVRLALAPDKKPDLHEAGEFYSASIGAMGKFLEGAQDLALRGAASQLGQRGGRKTQAKRRAEKQANFQRKEAGVCVLCRDPMARGLTVEIIQEHRRHENHGSPPPPTSDESGPERNGAGLYAKQAIGYPGPDNP